MFEQVTDPPPPDDDVLCLGDDFAYALLRGASSSNAVAFLKQVDLSRIQRSDAVFMSGAAERARRMIDALVVRLQAVAAGPGPGEGGVDEAAEELACEMQMHPHTAVADVTASRNIARRLPLTLRFLEAGEISLRQARQVELATRELDPATVALIEAEAVPGDPRRLKSRLARAMDRHASDAVRKKAEENRSARRVDYWSDPVEGVAGIAVQGPIEQMAHVKAAVDAEARARVAGECRTLGSRRFDVLLDWARERIGLSDGQTDDQASVDGKVGSSCTTCGRTGRSRIPVNVTVSLATLLRLSEASGDLDGVPIPAEVARDLAADGAWRRWLIEPTSGHLLDVGSTTYRPNAALDRFVRARDRTCRFPGCRRPTVRCDLDHTLAFHTECGETVPGNLVALCRRHHRLKHESDWSYRVDQSGGVVWTSPTGRTYRQPPEDHGDDPLLSELFARWHAQDRKKQSRSRPDRTGSAAATDVAAVARP